MFKRVLIFLLPCISFAFDYKPIILKVYQNNSVLISKVYTNKSENSFTIKVPYNTQMQYVDVTSGKCKIVNKSFLSNSGILFNDVEYGIKKLNAENDDLNKENLKYLEEGQKDTINKKIAKNVELINKNNKSIDILKDKLDKIASQKDLIVNFTCKNHARHDFFVKYYIRVKNYIKYKLYSNINDGTLNVQSILYLKLDRAYGKHINIFYYAYKVDSSVKSPKRFKPIKIEDGLDELNYYLDIRDRGSNTYAPVVIPKNRKYISKFFKITGVNLQKENEIRLANDLYDAHYEFIITGYDNSHIFLKQNFKSSKTYLRGKYKYYIDGKLVYRGNMGDILAGDNNTIYLPLENFISVKRDNIVNYKKQVKMKNGKVKMDIGYDYTIMNLVNYDLNVTLLESLPISKNSNYTIKNKTKTKYDSMSNDGEVYYKFIIKPNSSKEFEYRYSVVYPKNM